MWKAQGRVLESDAGHGSVRRKRADKAGQRELGAGGRCEGAAFTSMDTGQPATVSRSKRERWKFEARPVWEMRVAGSCWGSPTRTLQGRVAKHT